MKSKLGPWLVMAAIFIAGALSGAALTMALGPRPEGGPGDHLPGPAQIRTHMMDRMTQRLKLTPDQREKIQPILEETSTKIQALHRDELDKGAEIFKATDEQIAGLLTPDQAAELKKMRDEREKMFSGHMRPWGGPGGGPGGHHHDGPEDEAPQPPPPPPDAGPKGK